MDVGIEIEYFGGEEIGGGTMEFLVSTGPQGPVFVQPAIALRLMRWMPQKYES